MSTLGWVGLVIIVVAAAISIILLRKIWEKKNLSFYIVTIFIIVAIAAWICAMAGEEWVSVLDVIVLAALVLITAEYVRKTEEIARATREQANEIQKQANATVELATRSKEQASATVKLAESTEALALKTAEMAEATKTQADNMEEMAAATREQTDVSSKSLNELEKQRLDSVRPIISLQYSSSSPQVIATTFKNIGVGPALKLKFYFSHPQYDFQTKHEKTYILAVNTDGNIALPTEEHSLDQLWPGLCVNCDYEDIYKRPFRSVLRFSSKVERELEIIEL